MKVDPKLIAEMEKKGLIEPLIDRYGRGEPAPMKEDLARELREGWDEKTFTREVIGLAQSLGWYAAHFRPGLTRKGQWITAVQGDGKGFFDLVLVRERVLFTELKVGYNKPTPEQEQWAKWMTAAGQEVFLWYPKDWPEIEEELK